MFYICYIQYLNLYNQPPKIEAPLFKSDILNTYYHYYLFTYQTNQQNYHLAYQSYQTAKQDLIETTSTKALQTLEINFGYFLSCLSFYDESNDHLSRLNITSDNLNFAYYILGWNFLFKGNLVQSLQSFKRIHTGSRNKELYFLLAYLALKFNNKSLMITYIQLSQNVIVDHLPYTHLLIQWIVANKKITHTKRSLQLLEYVYTKHKQDLKPLLKRLIQHELLSYYLEVHDYQKATYHLLEVNDGCSTKR